jgi:cbb3-type cytochrome oxidase maturation protein
MSVLVLLVFASLAIATAFLVSFIWAVRSGQYEDTCTPSMRVLMEDAAPATFRNGPPSPARDGETHSVPNDSTHP